MCATRGIIHNRSELATGLLNDITKQRIIGGLPDNVNTSMVLGYFLFHLKRLSRIQPVTPGEGGWCYFVRVKMGKNRKKSLRLCCACGYRHANPTGKNCTLGEPELPPDNCHLDASDEMSSSDKDRGAAAPKMPSQAALQKAAQAVQVEFKFSAPRLLRKVM